MSDILPNPEMLDKLFSPDLQELRRNADMLFAILKAKKRLYDLYIPNVTLDDIAIAEENYKQAERKCQLKRKELGLPYNLQEENQNE